jgi:hypothetical protein
MTYSLTQLAADIRETLKADTSPAAKQKVCGLVSKALLDKAFVATHLTDCICGHVYDGPAKGSPHDHGASWAIYGQATGVTQMTDWRIVETGSGDKPTLVEPLNTYAMNPGDAHLYDVGDVHSPDRHAPVRLIRIEGKNLDHVKRSNIKAK